MTPISTDEVVRSYVAAWSTTDELMRRNLLERAWADDGIYCDPLGLVEGREALARYIAAFQQNQPGARIPLASGVDGHHGFVRFRWIMRDGNGKVMVEGFDVGELGSDGRLKRITGFFGPFPPIPLAWPADLVDRD